MSGYYWQPPSKSSESLHVPGKSWPWPSPFPLLGLLSSLLCPQQGGGKRKGSSFEKQLFKSVPEVEAISFLLFSSFLHFFLQDSVGTEACKSFCSELFHEFAALLF